MDDAERGDDDVFVGGGDDEAGLGEEGPDERLELRLVEEGEAALQGLAQDLPRPLESQPLAGDPEPPHAHEMPERHEDGAEDRE